MVIWVKIVDSAVNGIGVSGVFFNKISEFLIDKLLHSGYDNISLWPRE
jgi:hypothetical protein